MAAEDVLPATNPPLHYRCIERDTYLMREIDIMDFYELDFALTIPAEAFQGWEKTLRSGICILWLWRLGESEMEQAGFDT